MTFPQSPRPEHPHAVPPRRRGVVVLAIAAVVAVGAAFAWWLERRAQDAPDHPTAAAIAELDRNARAPAGERIRVRVVNATLTRGLARRVTNLVRDHGYDVVDYDSDARNLRDSTVVVLHVGQRDWAERLARAVGTATIEERPDSSRYVDLTVIIGADWKAPPTQPFRP